MVSGPAGTEPAGHHRAARLSPSGRPFPSARHESFCVQLAPHTTADVARMLEALGLDDLDDLFAHLPERVRLARRLDLPAGCSEDDVVNHMTELARQIGRAHV